MRIGLDFGISFTDIALESADGSAQVLRHFPSDRKVSVARVRELLAEVDVAVKDLHSLAVTGGHSALLPEDIDGVPVHRVNEIDALGACAGVLLGDAYQPPLLIVNSGSGTTCVLVSADGYRHVGGNATGGGTLVGLAKLTLGTIDPPEIERLAHLGHAAAVDLRMDDVASNPIGSLPPDATAVNFGQLIHGDATINREDTAAGLANLIGQSIALTSLFSATAVGVSQICVVGRTPQLAGIRYAMERVFDLPMVNIRSVFPELGPSASALGALEHTRPASK